MAVLLTLAVLTMAILTMAPPTSRPRRHSRAIALGTHVRRRAWNGVPPGGPPGEDHGKGGVGVRVG